MTIRHYQIFAAVVDCKTMHRAAESLYISQPGVSQAVRELENYYQVKLFERYKKKLFLTPEGDKLLKHVRILLAQYEALNRDMLEAREKPVLRIGATVSVGEELLVPLVTEFEKQYPNIRTQVLVNNSEFVEQAILEGKLDAALIEGEVISDEVEQIPFYEDCMQVVAAADHPLSGCECVEPEQLSSFDIITREPGSQARNVLLNMLREQGAVGRIKWTCTNVPTIKQAVIAGQGITVLSSLVIRKELGEGKLCVLKVKGLNGRRTIHLVMHKEKNKMGAVGTFLEFCGNYHESLTLDSPNV